MIYGDYESQLMCLFISYSGSFFAFVIRASSKCVVIIPGASAGYIWRGLVLWLQPSGVCIWWQNPEDLGRQLGEGAHRIEQWLVLVAAHPNSVFTLLHYLSDFIGL